MYLEDFPISQAAVDRVEAELLRDQDKYREPRSYVLRLHLNSAARLIAEDCVAGVEQWPQRVESFVILHRLDDGDPAMRDPRTSACPDCGKPGRWSVDDDWSHEVYADALACSREGQPSTSLADVTDSPYHDLAEPCSLCGRPQHAPLEVTSLNNAIAGLVAHTDSAIGKILGA
jgi:hypothetical protein